MRMPDHRAYSLLAEYKIPIARLELVNSAQAASAAAADLGWPAVLKIDGDIPHKRVAGCVAIVHSTAEAERAFERIMERAAALTQTIHGVIVQEFLTGAELLVGAKVDRQFGHVIAFGSGGPAAEARADVTFKLAPLSRPDAELMIKETAAWQTFTELSIPEIFDGIVGVLCNLSRLVLDQPAIRELDINPLFASAERIAAADVRIVLENF